MDSTDGDPKSTRLSDSLPCSNRGAIIFATRSRKAAEALTQASVIRLDDMDRTEAKQLLSQRLTQKTLVEDEKAVDELLELLAYLPLAIVQAVAFINNNQISISEYISLFKQPGTEAELFNEHFRGP
jgi:hypothetical protein